MYLIDYQYIYNIIPEMSKRLVLTLIVSIGLGFFFPGHSYSQPELMAWGNLSGIRIDGQMMEFETSLRTAGTGWQKVNSTGFHMNTSKYLRDGNKQTVTTSIGDIRFSKTVESVGRGSAVLRISTSSGKDTVLHGVFCSFNLPGKYSHDATIISGKSRIFLSKVRSENNSDPAKLTSESIIIKSAKGQLILDFDSRTDIFIRKEGNENDFQVYISLTDQKIIKEKEYQKTITIQAICEIDHSPVDIIIDPKKPGSMFAGLGGNFKLQNLKADPVVADYCLDNLRVAWGRVEMPWHLWHPDEDVNPLEEARAGHLNPRVHMAMEMAQKMERVGMPVIVSIWSPARWATIGNKTGRNSKLDPAKMDKVYQSITEYLIFLKEAYGVEAALFSFNEPDIGVDVRLNGQEHATFIKGMGEYLITRGLSTKILLGDNGSPRTLNFIKPALNDHETHKYIGAVSFHSWGGASDDVLRQWSECAQQIGVPLIVGEGSTDSYAWNYPRIIFEPSFAMEEINLYIRILAHSQPLSILQWELTADYSLLSGEGIFGTQGPLQPTQRFWNLKQVASTPVNSFALPVTCNNESVVCAAFGNIARSEYAVHIVNNGAERHAYLRCIPSGILVLEIYTTNSNSNMEMKKISVIDGVAEITLSPASFITVKGTK
jgi:hypothetical protein